MVSIEAMPFCCFWACEILNYFKREEIMDFAYSLGVVRRIEDGSWRQCKRRQLMLLNE